MMWSKNMIYVHRILAALCLLLLATVATGQETRNVTTYYHNTLQGTPIAATDEDGAVKWTQTYSSYGFHRGNAQSTEASSIRFGLSGHVEDQFDGRLLIYMQARYYDPEMGRFLSIDPVGFLESNPQSFNRYTYANNNPTTYVDPDGNLPIFVAPLLYKAAIFIAKEAVLEYASRKTGGATDFLSSRRALKQATKIFSRRSLSTARNVEVPNSGAKSAKQAADLKEHLRQSEKYGQGGVKDLPNGRTRYYGETVPANKPGEMAGRRTVREWDPATGNKRTWHETVDHSGNVRQVRPELNNGSKTHYTFDRGGNYTGSW